AMLAQTVQRLADGELQRLRSAHGDAGAVNQGAVLQAQLADLRRELSDRSMRALELEHVRDPALIADLLRNRMSVAYAEAGDLVARLCAAAVVREDFQEDWRLLGGRLF